MLPPPAPYPAVVGEDPAAPARSPSTVEFEKLVVARGCVWFCSLIVYSVQASVKNYSDSDALKFVVAMGVINWLYQGAIVGNYVASKYFQKEIMPVDVVEFKYAKPADILMLFLFYTSTIAASVDSSECVAAGSTCSKQHAVAFFSWFGFFGIGAIIYLRDPEALKKLVLRAKSDHYDDIDLNTANGTAGGEPKPAVDL